SCQNPPSCQNEGFVAHTCQCLCPSELTGTTCEQVTTDTGCGGVINLSSGQSQTIESPGYPNAVSTDKECVWLVRGPSESNIRLTIDELDLARNNFDSKCYHWLEIRFNMIGQSGIRQCNTVSGQNYLTTNDGESNLMLLKFDSRFNKNTQTSQGQRFKLTVKAEGGTSSNPCDPNPCLNSGSCTVVGSTFDCTCSTGWTGTTCDTPVLSCQPNPCQNGGTCSIIGNSVSCDCPPGWIGPNCETSSTATSTTTTTTTTTVTPPTGTSRLCNFESTNCWMVKYGELYSVQVSSGMEPYAGYLNTARYGYLLPGYSFILESPSGTLSNKQYCISFGFYINGYNPYVGVYFRNMSQQIQFLWSYNQTTNGNWYSVEIPFYGTSSDHIAIEGYISYGTFAIDEIRLLEGACPAGFRR
ncbi:fibropellin-1-like, partial [Saccostrea cucullata]|uniref:fibropellin-1-like n=1 Tax=Saccostrea cuccullata TaxID=36930 RepID=UPI002ED21450